MFAYFEEDQEKIDYLRELKEMNNNEVKFNKNSKTQMLKFASYNVPKFSEKPYKKWVNAGTDNLYPQYLMNQYHRSPTHSAIIDDKVAQLIGEGFVVDDSEDKDQLAEVNEFLKKIDANNLLRNLAFDYSVFGYFTLGLTWSNDRTKLADIFHIDASAVRTGVPILQDNNITRKVEEYFYSEDWSKWRHKNFSPDAFKVFNPAVRIDPTYIMMIRRYEPGVRFYGFPDYVAAMDSIELEAEIASYQLNSIKNGLSPSMIVSFNNGEPSQEQQQADWNMLNSIYAGSNNAGRVIVTYSSSKDTAPTYTPIQISNQSEVLAGLNESCVFSIVRAHRLPSPVLAGVAIPGQMGLTNEMIQSSELFTNHYIYPIQLLFEETFNDLLELNGFTIKIRIKDSKPVSFTFEDATLTQILTATEMRKMIDFTPLSEADKPNLVVNLKAEGGGKDSSKGAAPAKPEPAKAITKEQSDEQGMSSEAPTNRTITGMSGRENQSLMRILRQYGSGKLNRVQASLLLSQGYGLSPQDVETFLGDEPENEEVIDTLDKLKEYVTGHSTEQSHSVSSSLPKYVDELPNKKKKQN